MATSKKIGGRKPPVRLSDHAFAFFDLLGLRELMAGTATNKRHATRVLRSYHSALSDALASLSSHYDDLDDPPLWKHKIFTDNVVLAVHHWSDDWEDEIGVVSLRVAEFQYILSLRGWFIRGGITVGPLYMDDDVVFGPALVDAYLLESTRARDPRVLLSDYAARLTEGHLSYYADQEGSPQNGLFLRDVDGRAFLNYLYYPIYMDTPQSEVHANMLLHKDQVEEKLTTTRSNPPVWSKYRWVAEYHNLFVASFLPNSTGLAISSSAMGARPALLVPPGTSRRRSTP